MHAAGCSGATILEIRNQTTAIQEEGGSAVASFRHHLRPGRDLTLQPATPSMQPGPISSWTARPPRDVVSNLLRSGGSAAHHPGGTNGVDYQKLSVVLWGIVKKLQKRAEKLEKNKRRGGDSD